ncbi:MAG: 30S ribosomal protein S18 [Candidatus Ancillula trichonymphae]|jgi:small subunit ribosomal protein S18|nr:30S ribosomal protein S18 [Candidatus Ancillula trichonymphae]
MKERIVRKKPSYNTAGFKKVNLLKNVPPEDIDYKNVTLLRKFIQDRGKIRSREVTNVTIQQQRLIANAIKNARELALLPFVQTGVQKRRVVSNDKAYIEPER